MLGDIAIDPQRLAIGCVLAVLTWLVIVHGVQSIGRAAAKLSPLKVGLYLVGGIIVLVTHASALPETLALVFREAFSARAAVGTVAGVGIWQAIRFGLARGIYANEAGYGTAAVAYGTAKSCASRTAGTQRRDGSVHHLLRHVVDQCAHRARHWRVEARDAGNCPRGGQDARPEAVPAAFNAAMPTVGGWMVAVSVFLFGYTTLIGWAYYGEQFLEYLFGPRIIMPYRWLFCLLDSARRGRQARPGLGLGRHAQRPADFSERHRPGGPERTGRVVRHRDAKPSVAPNRFERHGASTRLGRSRRFWHATDLEPIIGRDQPRNQRHRDRVRRCNRVADRHAKLIPKLLSRQTDVRRGRVRPGIPGTESHSPLEIRYTTADSHTVRS